MGTFFENTMAAIRAAVAQQFDGNVSKAANAWGIQGDTLHKWLRGDRIPTLEKISPVLDSISPRHWQKTIWQLLWLATLGLEPDTYLRKMSKAGSWSTDISQH